MSDYMIAYLPSKEVSDYATKLIIELGEKYNEKYLIENPRPVHVTLKSPFEIEDIEPVELLLENFVNGVKSADVSASDFADFRGHVFFLKANFSEEALEIQKKLTEKLKSFLYMDKYSEQFTPHLTITYANTQESYDGIVSSLTNLPKPNFKFKFDNVTILKKVGNAWKVYKRFEIQ
ncbi:MAG: 2'-5' RNA ligase family protein [archaeon]